MPPYCEHHFTYHAIGDDCRPLAPLTFTLTITLGNDAMQDGGDIAEALEWVADHTDIMGSREGSIRDRNGNTVGKWEVK